MVENVVITIAASAQAGRVGVEDRFTKIVSEPSDACRPGSHAITSHSPITVQLAFDA